MAWNTPRTFVTGEVITATIMNTNIRSNLNATAAGVASAAGNIFYAPASNAISPVAIGLAHQLLTVNSSGNAPAWAEGYMPLDIVTTEVEAVNTVAETTLYTSRDIGGTLLGTTGAAKLIFLLSHLNNSGANRDLTVNIKLDSTTLLTPLSAASVGTSATRRVGWMVYTLAQKGAVNLQRHTLEYFTTTSGGSGGGFPISVADPADSNINEASSTIDLSSGTHNIVITVQHSSAAATVSCILRFAGLFIMRPV